MFQEISVKNREREIEGNYRIADGDDGLKLRKVNAAAELTFVNSSPLPSGVMPGKLSISL